MVGSALVRAAKQRGYSEILTRTHQELDLLSSEEVDKFFAVEKPDWVFLAAAKVGGIYANDTYR
ncbi:MAG: NAD-dependent epimerase/dehydratase family protein, partial [Arenicellales bacterium]